MRSRVLILIIPVLLLSCTSGRMIQLGNEASRAGMEVCADALEVYSTLAGEAETEKLFQDRVKVLINPDPASMTLPDSETTDFSDQLGLRVQAYKSLLTTYKTFNLLTDKAYSKKNEEAVVALQNSYNAIEGLPDLPGEVSSKLPGVAKYLSEAFQAKKIKKHNEALFALSEAYLALWQSDSRLWIEYIDRIYDDYTNGLNQVSSDRYDPEAISRELHLPYKDKDVLLVLYRIEIRNEIRAEKQSIIESINDVEKALVELTYLHSEISKDKPSIPDIISTLDTIESLLEN